jgi:hypothetical protein
MKETIERSEAMKEPKAKKLSKPWRCPKTGKVLAKGTKVFTWGGFQMTGSTLRKAQRTISWLMAK